MTAAVLPHNSRRMPWVPAIALFLATAALVIAVVALVIAPSDASSHAPSAPTHVSTEVSRPPVHLPHPTRAVIDCRAHRAGTAC